MKYYRNLYIPDRNYMMALELDDGNIVECLTESDILKFCNNTSSSTSITVNETTFIKNQVKSVYFGDDWDMNNTARYFCYSFSNLTYIDPLPNIITSIGNTFMSNCSSFNQPITIPESVTSIGNSFMQSCSSFNQPLTLPSSLISIGSTFLDDCRNFTGPLEILFTDPNIFASSDYSLSMNATIYPIYSTGVTITGNMTGVQLKTVLPNLHSNPYRNILD